MNASGTSTRGMNEPETLFPLAAGILALLFVCSEGKAQAPRFGETKTAQGRVQSLTTAPMGEIDGAVLDDGTVIHWPPHLAARFAGVVARGDRVKASGWMETGPAGDTHLEVQTVTNQRTNASVENDGGPPPPPPGSGRRAGPPPPPLGRPGFPGPRSGETKTAQGRVQSLTTAPMGEVDGAVLDDGTVIHWPPHLASRYTAVVSRGDRVKVSGWMETGPAGDTHLEVQAATNLRTDASAGTDVAALPATGVAPDGSDDFAASPDRSSAVERRFQELQDQINELRDEVRRLRSAR